MSEAWFFLDGFSSSRIFLSFYSASSPGYNYLCNSADYIFKRQKNIVTKWVVELSLKIYNSIHKYLTFFTQLYFKLGCTLCQYCPSLYFKRVTSKAAPFEGYSLIPHLQGPTDCGPEWPGWFKGALGPTPVEICIPIIQCTEGPDSSQAPSCMIFFFFFFCSPVLMKYFGTSS